MIYDPRRSIARLAAAVMAADAKITSSEIASLAGLVRLGLGTLEDLTREELLRSAHEPIDVRTACADLATVYPEAGSVILAALAEIAASDDAIDPREADLLANIAALLGVPPPAASHIVRAASGESVPADAGQVLPAEAAAAPIPAEAPARPSRDDGLAAAYAVLGLEPGASRAALDAAYRAVIERYQPVKVIDLGPEFAALAVRRLAAATAAFAAVADCPIGI